MHPRSFLPTVVWMTTMKKQIITLKHPSTMNKKELWSKILNIVITILTAVATSFGVTSCIGA
jgi:hypothetical protein